MNNDIEKSPQLEGELAVTVTQQATGDALMHRLRYCRDLLRGLERKAGDSNEDRLIWRDGTGKVCWTAVEEGMSIGRGGGSTLTIPNDSHLSRQHFRLVRRDERHVIEDLHSRNGTFINNTQLRIQTHELRDGDFILAGSQAFVYLRRTEGQSV